MDIAIIGLPQSGKTTLFNALTAGRADTSSGGGPGGQARVGVVKVADPRLETLATIYNPRKVIHAEVKYWDIPGPESLAEQRGIDGRYRNVLQGADSYLLVLRTFTNPAAPHPSGSVDPKRDLEAMLGELSLADLEVLERAVERLEDGVKKSKPAERPALLHRMETVQKVKREMENGTPSRRLSLTPSEAAAIGDYQLLTAKPIIVAFNTDESGPKPSLAQLDLPEVTTAGLGEVCISAKLDEELALMSPEEADEFRQAMELEESAVDRVIVECYRTVGLVSFLTVGEDEVRAWSVSAGLAAQHAAGAIHTDFTRGFIRAEVIPYDDLVRCGSIAQGRKEGVLRSEGKTYGVKDGDVINFLVNV